MAPRWVVRLTAFVLIPAAAVLAVESAARLVDARTGFWNSLAHILDTCAVQVDGGRVAPQRVDYEFWDDFGESPVWIRSPVAAAKRGEPMVMGGQVIPQAMNANFPSEILRPNRVASGRGAVFIVGASAAFGMHYPYRLTFAYQLGRMLADRGLRVFNAAQGGTTSVDMARVGKRVVDLFHPTVLIVYPSYNDFLEWTVPRFFLGNPWLRRALAGLRFCARSRALAGLEYVLLRRRVGAQDLLRQRQVRDRPGEFSVHAEMTGISYALRFPLRSYSGYDPRRWFRDKADFLDAYEYNLRKLVDYAQARGTRVILVAAPFNYRLSPAWKQPQPECVRRDTCGVVRGLVHRAGGLIRRGNCSEALPLVERALLLDAAVPILHYMQGMCLEAAGDFPAAEAAYARSQEAKLGNLGSPAAHNERIRKIAKASGLELLDAKRLFDREAHRQGRYFNEGLVDDDCHPSPEGHRILARELARIIRSPGPGRKTASNR